MERFSLFFLQVFLFINPISLCLNPWTVESSVASSMLFLEPRYRKQAKTNGASWLTLFANNFFRIISYFLFWLIKNHLMFTHAVVQNLWNRCIKFLPALSTWGWKERKRYCQAFWVTKKRSNVWLFYVNFSDCCSDLISGLINHTMFFVGCNFEAPAEATQNSIVTSAGFVKSMWKENCQRALS